MSSWQNSVVTHGGRQLAFRTHGPETALPVIALHGWQDNAASFELLGPLLPELRLIAIDMPGHGLSSWRGSDGTYCIWTYLEDVLAVVNSLQLQRFALLGHSMGGAIACLLAGLLPERVIRLGLLDSVGPLATSAAAAPDQMLRALQQQQNLKTGVRRYYNSFAAAVAARAAKGLGTEAATILGRRGIAEDAQGFFWTLDPRLSLASLLSLTEEQAAVFIRRIEGPVQLIAAPEYWLQRRAWFDLRCGYFRQLQLHELPGNHHQHLDGQVAAVAALLGAYFI
jgi:pimeloyl-ACP methyl ester carboxylesterase